MLFNDRFMDDTTDDLVEELYATRTETKRILHEMNAKALSDDFMDLFKTLCTHYSLPLDNKLLFCDKLCHLIDTNYTEDLLWLYLTLVADKGLVFDVDRTNRTEYKDMVNYVDMDTDISNLLDLFTTTAEYKKSFENLLKNITLEKKRLNDTIINSDKYNLINIFLKFIDRPQSDISSTLSDNVELICNKLYSSKELRKIAPLFIYQVMTKHPKRIFTQNNFDLNIKNLWDCREHQIDRDDGKNFNTLERKITLFFDLIDYYEKDKDVNTEVTLYGFSHLSNVWDWFHDYNDCTDQTIIVPIRRLFQLRAFTCFSTGSFGTTLFDEYAIDQEDIDPFLNHDKPQYKFVAEPTTKYISNDATIIIKYIEAIKNYDKKSLEELVFLVFSNPHIKMQYIKEKDLPLVYKVINSILLNYSDLETTQKLIQSGEKLLDSISTRL